ncbi:hypothetical protein D3C81_2160940 [compost metagenome]
MLEGQADIVQAQQQELAAVLVKLEGNTQAGSVRDHLVFQVHSQLVALLGG